jgi:UDPglucose 6-dehydrogenase
VPVQTGQQLKRQLEVYGRAPGVKFTVASNPEFLREGTAVGDFLHPDRIVVGVDDPGAEKQLREIYAPILDRTFACPVHNGHCPPAPQPPFVVTTINSAELIKHASNSFLAVKISYANAIAELCERMGANVQEVTRAMGMDPRIGPAFLNAGLGFGGFCLPKDLQAFGRMAERLGYDFGLLAEVERINQERITRFLGKAKELLGTLSGRTVALLGLSFKPNTDDIRFAPSLSVMEELLREHALVRAYDPRASAKVRELFPTVTCAPNPYDAARGADCLLLLTEWEEFQRLDWERMGQAMKRRAVVDGRNCLDRQALKQAGFVYRGMGRPA